MSIQSELSRIDNNIKAALEKIANRGVAVPENANSDSLPSLIELIPRGENLDNVLTEQEALIAELKGVLQGKAGGGGGDTMVGWWEFNEELELHDFDFYFNFTLPRLGNRLFTNLFTDIGDDYANLLCADDEVENTMYDVNGWVGEEYRLMHLAEEPEDAEAKAWVKAHARKLTYDECYAEGEKAILSTFVDWSVSAASNSCVVEYYNDCDYYAHIAIYIKASVSDEYYSEEFVIAPYNSYSISTEEMGWQVNNAEWYVSSQICKFSKDGDGEI